MIVVFDDTHTHWRRKPFEAWACLMPVLGARPRGVLCAWRERRMAALGAGEMFEWAVALPLGWVSRTAGVFQWWS